MAAVLLVISVLGGIYCLVRLNDNENRNERLAASVIEQRDEIERLKGEGSKVQQLLTEDQKSLLTAAHKLVANKTFGWSRLFADLESVLPGSVSASRISVENIYQDADRISAELELSVLSRNYPAVISMIDRMNGSGLFQAELRGQNLQKNERVTFTEYTFKIIYTPAYRFAAESPTDIAQAQGGGLE
jgi:Tfp pilus assembly protein PilN